MSIEDIEDRVKVVVQYVSSSEMHKVEIKLVNLVKELKQTLELVQTMNGSLLNIQMSLSQNQ